MPWTRRTGIAWPWCGARGEGGERQVREQGGEIQPDPLTVRGPGRKVRLSTEIQPSEEAEQLIVVERGEGERDGAKKRVGDRTARGSEAEGGIRA